MFCNSDLAVCLSWFYWGWILQMINFSTIFIPSWTYQKNELFVQMHIIYIIWSLNPEARYIYIIYNQDYNLDFDFAINFWWLQSVLLCQLRNSYSKATGLWTFTLMPFTYHLEIQQEQHNWSALQGLPCTSVSSCGFEHFGYLSYSNLWWLFSCVLQLLEMWQFNIKMSSKTEKANRDIASSNVCTYALKAQPVNSLMNTHTSFFILGGVCKAVYIHWASYICLVREWKRSQQFLPAEANTC